MFTLRATAKLLKRLRVSSGEAPAPSLAPTTRLGDWYANLLFVRPAHLVLCVSERTLLPVLLPAKDLASLPSRLASALGEVLRTVGVGEAKVAAELAQMAEWGIAKTASRQVLGTMNDFAWMLEADADEGRGLLERALWLAQTPCSPLKLHFPDRATLEVFGQPSP